MAEYMKANFLKIKNKELGMIYNKMVTLILVKYKKIKNMDQGRCIGLILQHKIHFNFMMENGGQDFQAEMDII